MSVRKELNMLEGQAMLADPNACNEKIAGRPRQECNKIHYLANKEHIIAKQRAWEHANRDQRKAYQAKWYLAKKQAKIAQVQASS